MPDPGADATNENDPDLLAPTEFPPDEYPDPEQIPADLGSDQRVTS